MSNANVTLSILQVAALCSEGKMSIESRFIKDDKGQAVQRWFINRTGVRGTLTITSGDCTRLDEEYQKPFLGKKPDRHPDSLPDCTSKGALTIIPDKEEGEAWCIFNQWIKREILRVGAVKDKKNQVVTTMEKLESEFKDIIVEPDKTKADRQNVCFWQKFQVGSKIADLNTKFYYISCTEDEHGGKTVTRGAEFSDDVLKAGMPIFTVISVGELKKSPTGWGISLYTRHAYMNEPSEDDSTEPVVMFGGVKVLTAESKKPKANELKRGREAEAVLGFEPEPEFEQEYVPVKTETEAAVLPVAQEETVLDVGVSSDISELAKSLAKFNDPDRVETKRARTGR